MRPFFSHKRITSGNPQRIPSIEQLNSRALKSIVVLLAISMAVMAADFISSGSQEIDMIESGGSTYMLRPDDSTGHVTLVARISTGDGEIKDTINVSLDPVTSGSENSPETTAKPESAEDTAEYELRTISSSFNNDTSRRRVLLPSSTAGGEKIEWSVKSDSHAVLILLATIIIGALIYLSRLSPLKKIREQQRSSISRQLPGFVNRLVLLLNAGMVLNSAFEKAIKESLRFSSAEGDYFYGKMQEIYNTIRLTNGSCDVEFRRFARESGMTEMLRISNIISDNMAKGVELTGKLQRESDGLWIARKRSCEERGRLAETKLTLPLTLFLLVLIVITITPALIEL